MTLGPDSERWETPTLRHRLLGASNRVSEEGGFNNSSIGSLGWLTILV